MIKYTLSIFAVLFSFFTLPAQNKNVQDLIKEGVALHDSTLYRASIKKFEEALKINPQSEQANYEMALSYLKLKDYKNASKFSTEVIDSNDKVLSLGAYAIKSEALAEMNQIDDAISLLKKGLEKNENNDMMHFNLALNYYKKGDLDNALKHVKKTIEINKTSAGAYLLNAYVLGDKKLWVDNILSFQMFLLLEPNSMRSKNAFAELLQTLRIKPVSNEPLERSYSHQQLQKTEKTDATTNVPPLSTVDGLNRNFVYHAITSTLDSLKSVRQDSIFVIFKDVNKAVIQVLERENTSDKSGITWNFYVPFFSTLINSDYYDTYCRYISAAYLPESMDWWNAHPKAAKKFISWFEYGDEGKPTDTKK
ncbi:MAG: tetratricopeptide repeat protein [Dysgonamonadaceae bacterium]|jgi:tetratricopeptide (TPR) repeat protein|nr:tetratricopeptide repeat protein [Dysgonamonadaceae bacterium]